MSPGLHFQQSSASDGSCSLFWQQSCDQNGSRKCEDEAPQPPASFHIPLPSFGPFMPNRDQDILSGHFKYLQEAEIGQGSFGYVVRAARLGSPPHSPCTVAIKLLPRGNSVRDFKTLIRREIFHQSSLQHPFIISIQEVFLTRTHLALVMEYAAGGDMFQTLSKWPGQCMPEEQARWIFQQLLIGLEYCHRKGVANRDLKLENMLLDREWTAIRPLLKICDFGYSKHDMTSPAKTRAGTPVYMAPEVILGGKRYDAKKADLWSCGVILFVMVYGRYPFDFMAKDCACKIVCGKYRQPRSPEVSRECKSLIQHLLLPDPRQRIELADILAQPWFRANLPPTALTMNDFYVQQEPQLDEYMEKVDHIVRQSLEVGCIDEDLTHANALAPRALW